MSDYLRYAFVDLTEPPQIDRRDFLKQAGAGIVVLVALGLPGGAQEPGRRGGRGGGLPEDFNAFLRIAEDGSITGFAGKVEMGQGATTSLAQMLAEELDAPLASITMVMGDTGLCPWDMGTFGSMTTRFLGPAFRQAAAEARAVLLELAADHLATPVARLRTSGGFVIDTADAARRVGYGELARGQRIQRVLERPALIQAAADYDVVGRDHEALESRAKVTGAALFAGDLRLPGMLYARLLRPPAHGARRRGLDVSGVAAVAGARVIQDGDLFAVLHPTPDGAAEALAAIQADWEVPPSALDPESIFDHLMAQAPAAQDIDAAGDPADGERAAAHVVSATYRNGYVAHAPIENHTAVAQVEGDRATVWASTQTPFPARDEIAQALDLPADAVRVIAPFVGGGFGGKSRNQQAVEAARLARVAGVPVHVEWTRAEEFFYDTFMPAAVVTVRAGASAAGDLLSWDFAVAYAGTRGSELLYHAPHRRIAAHGTGWRAAPGSHPFATGAWRAPGANTNAFARESSIDALAAAAGMDPVAFRLRNLRDARMKQVLEAAARRFGWRSRGAAGRRDGGGTARGQGVACTTDAGTWNAVMAEVEVDLASGAVRVLRAVGAQDMGLVVNPRGAILQAEGCITMGLGYALSEELRFRGGEVLDRNFDTYRLPRFSDVPAIEIVLVDTGVSEPHGGGEPAIVGMGAVIANAIFDATGARLTRFPMTPERVRSALGSTE